MFIYGEESYTAQIYQRPETSKINWREDFPRSVVASIPGKHGELEGSDECVACLAKILNEQIGPALAAQLAQSSAKIKELEAKLALSEAKGEVNETAGRIESPSDEGKKYTAKSFDELAHLGSAAALSRVLARVSKRQVRCRRGKLEPLCITSNGRHLICEPSGFRFVSRP